MIVMCQKCQREYDDENQSTICNHAVLPPAGPTYPSPVKRPPGYYADGAVGPSSGCCVSGNHSVDQAAAEPIEEKDRTAEAAGELRAALRHMYTEVTSALDGQPPRPILEVLRDENLKGSEITVQFSEWELRLIRFALERAIDSV